MKQALTVTITVDGAQYPTLADAYRPDIAAQHPGTGTTHGFDRVIPVAQGTHTVCVTPPTSATAGTRTSAAGPSP